MLQTGKNFAPLQQFEELTSNKPVTNPSSFIEQLQTKYQELMTRDDQPWREDYDIGQLVAAMIHGKDMVMRNPRTGRYAIVKGNNVRPKTVGGLAQFWFTKLTAEWLTSRPEIDPMCPSDADEMEEFIAAVKTQDDYYYKKFYTTQFEEDEFWSAAMFGTYVHRYDYSEEAQDLTIALLPFAACRWNRRKNAADSAYFIYHSKCSNAWLEQMLMADIAPDGQDAYNYGLQIINQIANSGGNVEGEGKNRLWTGYNDDQNENIVCEMWLKPEEYCNFDLTQAEDTISGESIPAGQKLIEMFPNGICVVGINSMQRIIGIYDEDFNDHIVVGVYHKRPLCGVGKGLSDMVDIIKNIDKYRTQKSAFIDVHATPATYFAKDMITEADIRNIGKPKMAIPVDLMGGPDGMNSINQAIQVLAPANVSGDIWNFGEELKQDLQLAAQTTDFSGGLPGVNNKTATGARIADSNTEMMLVPQHLNKADTRERAAKVRYKLFKKYIDKPKFFANNAKNAITQGEYIDNKKFQGVDLEFRVVANSEIPHTQMQQKQGLMELAQSGIMETVMALNSPEVTGEVLALFGVKLSLPSPKDIARVCRKRVNQAQQILEVEMQMQAQVASMLPEMAFNPEENANLPAEIVTQLVPPISTKELFHDLKITWLAELLDADEMQYAPMEMRYVIEAMIDAHVEAMTLGQMEMQYNANAATVMANQPIIKGQQAQDAQSQQMQAQYQQQMAMQQKEEADAGQGRALQLKAAEAELGESQAESAHGRNLEVEQVRASQKRAA